MVGVKFWSVLVSLALLAASAGAAAQIKPPAPATPAPEDVPVPVSGSLGLAGARCADISRYLNARAAVNPSLAPDGGELVYRTGVSGQPQLWVNGPDGPRQITFGESVNIAEWSPAGDGIAYSVDRGGDEREGYYLISPDGKRERELLAPTDSFREWGGFSRDGSQVAYAATEPGKADFNVYVLTVATGQTRRVLSGQAGIYPVAWRPDGKALVLSRVRGEDANDLLYLDLATGQASDLLVPSEASAYTQIAWTPDGKGFYLSTNQDRDFAALAYYDFAERKLRTVETPSHDVEAVALSGDGRYLAWSENVGGFSEARLRDLRTNRTVPILGLPKGVIQTLSWADRAARLAFQVSGPQVPGDVWVLNAQRGDLRRVTKSATGGLDESTFVIPEAVSFKSHDNETIYGLLYRPAGATTRTLPPAVVMVHGGPTAQARPDFDAATQYLVARGYAILDLNFRGSTGYGKRFARLDNGRLRPNAVKDMAAAVEWLGTQGIDNRRVAVMGGSYGGYMTFAALTTLPDVFQAGVGFVGVSNWITALEGASPQLKASDRYEYGNIDDPAEREFFTQLSPITYIKQVRSPLMVLHGANDPRDPVGEADQLVGALRSQGGDVEYLRFPDEGHSIRKLTNRVIAYRRIAAFLERTIGKGVAVCGS